MVGIYSLYGQFFKVAAPIYTSFHSTWEFQLFSFFANTWYCRTLELKLVYKLVEALFFKTKLLMILSNVSCTFFNIHILLRWEKFYPNVTPFLVNWAAFFLLCLWSSLYVIARSPFRNVPDKYFLPIYDKFFLSSVCLREVLSF